MKRFHFNLQVLLDLKKRNEDNAKRELALANSLLMQARNVLFDIEQEWNQLMEDEIVRRKEGTTAEFMGRMVSYRLDLQQRGLKQDLEIQRVMAFREKKRQLLVVATKEKKAIDNIKKRKFEEWKLRYRREEAKRIDDICQIQYVRNHCK
jgi:flagellar FliJ protein